MVRNVSISVQSLVLQTRDTWEFPAESHDAFRGEVEGFSNADWAIGAQMRSIVYYPPEV